MADLKNPAWMYVKAALLLVIGGLTFALLLVPQTLGSRIALQCLMAWAFARAYFFAFYVIEHYIDVDYKFSGLLNFFQHLFASRKRRTQRPEA